MGEAVCIVVPGDTQGWMAISWGWKAAAGGLRVAALSRGCAVCNARRVTFPAHCTVYLLVGSLMTVIGLWGEGVFNSVCTQNLPTKTVKLRTCGAAFAIKKRCLPPAAPGKCFQDNLRHGYRSPAGLLLKLYPFSEECGGLN